MVAFLHGWVEPDRSVSQEMGQIDPDLNTSPGPGDTGIIVARAKDGSRKRLRSHWIDIMSEVNLHRSRVGIYCFTLKQRPRRSGGPCWSKRAVYVLCRSSQPPCQPLEQALLDLASDSSLQSKARHPCSTTLKSSVATACKEEEDTGAKPEAPLKTERGNILLPAVELSQYSISHADH
jgi:hypothetical protein